MQGFCSCCNLLREPVSALFDLPLRCEPVFHSPALLPIPLTIEFIGASPNFEHFFLGFEKLIA
jgi:hypothetical protein